MRSQIPGIPKKEVSDMKSEIDEHIAKYTPFSLALLEVNINDSMPWYDAYGPDQRELAMRAYFKAMVIHGLREERAYGSERLFTIGRASDDKFLLIDIGNPDNLEGIAARLKERIDNTVIPNPENLLSKTYQWKGETFHLDPTHRTVRVGVAYQHQSPNGYDIDGLHQRMLEVADEAKALPGQILVVEFKPTNQ